MAMEQRRICVFLCNNKELLLILLVNEDLEECIYQLNSCTPSTMYLFILSSENTSFDMAVVIGATIWQSLWSSTSSAIIHLVFGAPNKSID